MLLERDATLAQQVDRTEDKSRREGKVTGWAHNSNSPSVCQLREWVPDVVPVTCYGILAVSEEDLH